MSAHIPEFESCALCPRDCHVDRTKGELGFCASDSEMMVSRAALHFWEEPTISASAGSGTIFFSGCNLKCSYCQNHAISRRRTGTSSSIEDVARMCLDLQNEGAMNINFVTPTHFSPLVRRSIEAARALGLELPIVWNTSGYECSETIKDNDSYVDVYLTDFKYFDDELSKAFSGVSDYRERAIEALDEMARSVGLPQFDEFNGEKRLAKGVVVRHMVLPGHVDDSKDIISFLKNRYDDEILLSIMSQYTPVLSSRAQAGDTFADSVLATYPELGREVDDLEYEEVLDYADSLGVKDYYWQDGKACLESFIPDFDTSIDRD